jgi:hypothetical protein
LMIRSGRSICAFINDSLPLKRRFRSLCPGCQALRSSMGSDQALPKSAALSINTSIRARKKGQGWVSRNVWRGSLKVKKISDGLLFIKCHKDYSQRLFGIRTIDGVIYGQREKGNS